METPAATKRKHEDGITNDDGQSTVIDNTNAQPANKKQKKKKNVRFDDVTVYYFARSQGFVSVPSQGTVTLGMVPEHSHVEQYSVTDFLRVRRAIHKSILRERKLLPPSSSNAMDSDNDEDEPLPVDDYYFVQPIATRQRRTLLKQAGLVKIDATEKYELASIRRSREVCGCSCTRETGGCQPTTCDCYLNGIACQVDRLTFPCPCATMLCKNPLGRLEFNQNRVRNHFFDTITRLEAEKKQDELGNLSLLVFISVHNLALACFTSQQTMSDDLSTITSILSSIISQIELEEYQIASAVHFLVSSVEDPVMITEESSTLLPMIYSSNVQTTCIPSSSKDHLIPTSRECQKSSLQRKTTNSLSSSAIISTELS
ncbi:unnamed protein product [Adineta ricciae]|uniref:Cysteine/serine-rich nuclear protein N-terminal domain-containing protein n=1 Tax=Adineta ricciae TaxID=249248 RepID=A0A814CK65_ADIRI|nr:unnamed protein product [Adineta ricciae]CAF0941329.1 unnamed protein product [Adineta ricciae]